MVNYLENSTICEYIWVQIGFQRFRNDFLQFQSAFRQSRLVFDIFKVLFCCPDWFLTISNCFSPVQSSAISAISECFLAVQLLSLQYLQTFTNLTSSYNFLQILSMLTNLMNSYKSFHFWSFLTNLKIFKIPQVFKFIADRNEISF